MESMTRKTLRFDRDGMTAALPRSSMCADQRVAVVGPISDDRFAFPAFCQKARLGDIVHLTGGDDVPDELAALRNGGMELRRQSTARPTESLRGLPACPAQRTRRVRMRFDDRAVDQNQLRLALRRLCRSVSQRPASAQRRNRR